MEQDFKVNRFNPNKDVLVKLCSQIGDSLSSYSPFNSSNISRPNKSYSSLSNIRKVSFWNTLEIPDWVKPLLVVLGIILLIYLIWGIDGLKNVGAFLLIGVFLQIFGRKKK